MAHGENAEKHVKEVWSRRAALGKSMMTLNKHSKKLTHRIERRQGKREAELAKQSENV